MPFRSRQLELCAVVAKHRKGYSSIPHNFGIMDSSMKAYWVLKVNIFSHATITYHV